MIVTFFVFFDLPISKRQEIKSKPGNVIHNCCMEEEIFPWQEEVCNVVLRGPDRGARPDAQVAQDVEDLGVTPELFQQGDDDFDVFFFHHVQCCVKIWDLVLHSVLSGMGPYLPESR